MQIEYVRAKVEKVRSLKGNSEAAHKEEDSFTLRSLEGHLVVGMRRSFGDSVRSAQD